MSKEQSFKAPVLLRKDHEVDNFDCGVESLNDYLKKYAYINNRNYSSRTYVVCRGKRVVGYYTITPGSVRKENTPLRVSKGLGNYPVPVIILARLAVDKEFQGMKIGEGLLKDALLRIVRASDSIGGRAVLVHAKNDKVKSFYEKYGFEQSPIDKFHLYLLIKDIKKSLSTL